MHSSVEVRLISWSRIWCFAFLNGLVLAATGSSVFTVQPFGNEGFDVLSNGVTIAPIRLAAESAIQADNIVSNASGLQLSGFHTKDPLAVIFATNDFVSISLPEPGETNSSGSWEPVVKFQLTVRS